MKMNKQRNMFHVKEQDKSSEIHLNDTGLRGLPDREFKTMIIQMFIKVRRAMHEQNDNLNSLKILKSTKQKSQH